MVDQDVLASRLSTLDDLEGRFGGFLRDLTKGEGLSKVRVVIE